MTKNSALGWRLPLVVLAVLVGGVWPAQGQFSQNGDFEGSFGSNGVASGWSTWTGGWSNTISFGRETTRNMAGAAAQRWGRADHLRVHGGLVQQRNVTPGVMYEVIAWGRLDSTDGGAWLEFGVDTTGQTSNGEASSVSYTKLETQGRGKWVRYRRLVKATGSTLSFFTKFGHYSEPAGSHWAYVDNVSIQPRTVLEAEDFNNSYDTTSGNAGGAYRTNVNTDIGAKPGGGYYVGWTAAGEWIEWTGVGSPGVDHAVVINYSAFSDASVRVSVNGTVLGGAVTLPRSGGWDSYRRVVLPGVHWIGSGTVTVRLTIDTAGCNIDSVELVPITAGPFLQAEDYTAFYDTTPGNTGGQYRNDNVDIGSSPEGYVVGWTANGEWLEYPIHGDARTYVAVVRYSAYSGTPVIAMTVDGVAATGNISLPATGNWNTYRSVVSAPFVLPTGPSTLRVTVVTAGCNLNYFALVPLGDGSAGSQQLAGVHFAGSFGSTNNVLQMASWRGQGNWISSVEMFYVFNRDPDTDAGFQNEMTNFAVNLCGPLMQNRIRPIVRIDSSYGQNIPPLLPNGGVDNGAVDRYIRTFRKFIQIANANGVPVRILIVGNEMNLKGEAEGFPNRVCPEWYYAYVYHEVRTMVTNTFGPGYEVLVGAVSPNSFSVDPLQTPPNSNSFYQLYYQDGLVYLDNVVQELKRKGTQNVHFAVHAYADFDTRQNYTINFMWSLRKQLEIIEKSHTVIPYGQSQQVTIGGYPNAKVHLTEWNRHTPLNSAEGRVWQETRTSEFIRRAMEHLRKWNTERLVWDNVANVWRTYDHRNIAHNFHPIETACYFVFDSGDGVTWAEYALQYWKNLSGSATGVNDMWDVYQSEVGRRVPAGR